MMSINARDLNRKSGERIGEISVWMLLLGDVFDRVSIFGGKT
jgi:hypothetical protein